MVLLCNAVPTVLQLLWSQVPEDFTSATVLMHVLLARMPRLEQQALLQEMLSTGAVLRLLLVMHQARGSPLHAVWTACTLSKALSLLHADG